MHFYGREKDIQRIDELIKREKSQFCYIRGRRRVGKSSLLKKFTEKNKNCFYFIGKEDTSTNELQMDFARQWQKFSGEDFLLKLKSEYLSWTEIFQSILQYVEKRKNKITIIFDEIQWIAKTGSGFVGSLKSAWLDWEGSGKINVLVCGSSNKFFFDHVGGEEKILRGMTTHSTIWLQQFSLQELKEYYFPDWALEQICLTYMMLGGVPYYLNQIDVRKPFVHAINEAVFTRQGVFLNEINEILNLDFNQKAMDNVISVVTTLSQSGISAAGVCKKTGIAQSTVYEILNKLCNYQIAFRRQDFEGINIFYLKDFYLNFYSRILESLRYKIETNEKGLLFPYECLPSNNCYYIPNFSGQAFELLIMSVLENRQYIVDSDFRLGLSKKLFFADVNYEIESYRNNQAQIDILVKHDSDRVVRLIECKWSDNMKIKDCISALQRKAAIYRKMKGDKYQQIKLFLCSGTQVTKDQLKTARESNVDVILPEDLFPY